MRRGELRIAAFLNALLKVLMGFFGAALVLVLGWHIMFIAVNWPDEPLSARTQALLLVPSWDATAAKDNLYFDLMGRNELGEGTANERGQRFVKAVLAAEKHALDNKLGDVAAQKAAGMWDRKYPSEARSKPPALKQCRDLDAGCWRDQLALASQWKAWLSAHPEHSLWFKRMLEETGYQSYRTPNWAPLVDHSELMRLLAHESTRAVAAFDAGDAELGLQRLALAKAFLSKLQTGERTLTGRLMALRMQEQLMATAALCIAKSSRGELLANADAWQRVIRPTTAAELDLRPAFESEAASGVRIYLSRFPEQDEAEIAVKYNFPAPPPKSLLVRLVVMHQALLDPLFMRQRYANGVAQQWLAIEPLLEDVVKNSAKLTSMVSKQHQAFEPPGLLEALTFSLKYHAPGNPVTGYVQYFDKPMQAARITAVVQAQFAIKTQGLDATEAAAWLKQRSEAAGSDRPDLAEMSFDPAQSSVVTRLVDGREPRLENFVAPLNLR